MKARELCSLLTVTLLLSASACFAGEYWVAPDGDDSGPGSKEGPFRTIQRGVNALKGGDTLFVRAGRYEEEVTVETDKSGSPGKWTTISAAPGDELKVVVGTEKPHVDSTSTAFALRMVKYVRLRGFKCLSAYRSRGSGIYVKRSTHVEILNCIAIGGGSGGIDANQCNFITIDGVETYFNGGGRAWSSGISLMPVGPNNVIRNTICYGNYDRSSFKSDGNGIIVDGGGPKVGALLVNNLTFMNGGQGICSTRADNCTFINNTSVFNTWEPFQADRGGDLTGPSEITLRGANNVARNNIGFARGTSGIGLFVLPAYHDVMVDLKTVTGDHNLWFSRGNPKCIVVSGHGPGRVTLEELLKELPHLAAESLSIDPGFVDAENLDFRLLPTSPALKAGLARPEVPTDLLGKPRPKEGKISLGVYEGPYDGKRKVLPKPAVEIAKGQDAEAIKRLLQNEYVLDWNGMLWGWGRMLPEELPLQVDVQGPRKADFLSISGKVVLKDLLDKIAKTHKVRLVLTQPTDCKGLPTTANVISKRLTIYKGASAEERAWIRKMLRIRVWTRDLEGEYTFAEQLPALEAALGLKIASDRPIPPDRKIRMITLNMQLSAVLTDLAEKMDLRFTLRRSDPLADSAKVQQQKLDEAFGASDGLVAVTVEQTARKRGGIDIFARIQGPTALRANTIPTHSNFLLTKGVDPNSKKEKEEEVSLNRAETRAQTKGVLRLATVGTGCALNVMGEWVLLSRLPDALKSGKFKVSAVRPWKVSDVRFVPLGGPAKGS